MKNLVVATALACSLVAPSVRAEPTKDACVASYDSSQKLRKGGKLLDAQSELRTCADPACPEMVRQDCLGWVREVEALTPTVIFAARDANGDDATDVMATIDGAAAPTALDGKAMSLDPGPHLIRLTRGAVVVEQKLIVAEGEKGRVVRLTIAAPEVKTPAPPRESTRPTPIATYVLGAVGATALVVGGALAWSGTRDLHNLRESCAPSCAPSDVSATRLKIGAGDVSFGVGLVSLGVAVALYVTRPSREAPPSAPLASVAIVPGGASLGFSASF